MGADDAEPVAAPKGVADAAPFEALTLVECAFATKFGDVEEAELEDPVEEAVVDAPEELEDQVVDDPVVEAADELEDQDVEEAVDEAADEDAEELDTAPSLPCT